MPSTGSRSWRCRTAQTVPPWASVWCTARSRPSVAPLHLRAVERAGPAFDPDAAAGRALPGLVVDAFLEEQQVDTPVGGRLERRAPAGGSAGVAAGLLLPPLDRLGLLLRAPGLEQRLDQLEQLRPGSRARRRSSSRRSPCAPRARARSRTPAASPRRRRRSASARAAGGSARRPARRPPSGGRGRASRCAAGSATATSRPGRGGRGCRRAARRSPRAGRRAGGRGRPARGRRRSPARPRRGRPARRVARGRGCC